MDCRQSVVIIGAGLVGPVCALFMARRGFRVTIYEYRDDPRSAKTVKGRSINLALSNRARKVLRELGLEDDVLKFNVSMKGRYIHNLNGGHKSILYDPKNKQCLYSVSRNYLNCKLLDELATKSNIKLHFNHKLINADMETNTVTILQTVTNTTIQDTADIIVGADGAFSRLRKAMQETPLYSFSQTYITHGYIEMSIPQETGSSMVPNHLHIWPRSEFMLIALPNFDGSWTVTLFMPYVAFEHLNLDFFRKVFPDAVQLIGDTNLSDYLKQKPSYLVSIKCGRLHEGGSVLIGDAAHAMVPFYGQGLNCGFSDCLILDTVIEMYQSDLRLALSKFTEQRSDDAHAICDLAMYNYKEMRDSVTRVTYLIRKAFDEAMFTFFPETWVPLYYSVTFSEIGYRKCMDNRAWQNKILQRFGISIIILGLILIFYIN